MRSAPENIAVLGSTGSIGTQTLDIIERYPERFSVRLLVANSNWRLLARQARKFCPAKVIIACEEYYDMLLNELQDLPIEIQAGADSIVSAMEDSLLETVVTGMVGYAGLAPTLKALEHGKRIALANKETLVAAGHLVMAAAKKYNADIIPVDSEHSAIFQCLRGECVSEAAKIILTASGGPFRSMPKEQLENVTAAQALLHPNWSMGRKVTIDSASMMNKGLEMIEAHWLFSCPSDKIEIVVHPQSIVHSMVQFADGSVKAQLGIPDMHHPIGYALSFPERLDSGNNSFLNISDYATLTFEKPDYDKFPQLRLAFEALDMGGNIPCAMNAANEVAVKYFLAGKIKFTDMAKLVEKVMKEISFISYPDYSQIVETNAEALKLSETIIPNL